eukprot:118550-Alexandrium_andersonii.AAC.1
MPRRPLAAAICQCCAARCRALVSAVMPPCRAIASSGAPPLPPRQAATDMQHSSAGAGRRPSPASPPQAA